MPGAAYPEKTGIYVNTEGRPQFAERATFPPGDAREDWAILRALSDALGARLPFDSLTQLRAALFAAHPHLAALDAVAPAAADFAALAALGGALDKAPLVTGLGDFFLTNPIARASESWPNVRRWPRRGVSRRRSRTLYDSVTPTRPALRIVR